MKKIFFALFLVSLKVTSSYAVGVYQVKPGEYESVVTIIDDGGSTQCSGVIIAPTVVLTAGHCSIRAGAVVFNQALTSQSEFKKIYSDYLKTKEDPTYKPENGEKLDFAEVRKAIKYNTEAQPSNDNPRAIKKWISKDIAVLRLTAPLKNFRTSSLGVVDISRDGTTSVTQVGYGSLHKTMKLWVDVTASKEKFSYFIFEGSGYFTHGDSGGPIFSVNQQVIGISSAMSQNGFYFAKITDEFVSWAREASGYAF